MNQKPGFAVFALRSSKVNGMRGSLLPASSSQRPARRSAARGNCTCNPVCSLVEQIVGNSWLLIMYHALKSVPENRRKAQGAQQKNELVNMQNAGKVAAKFSVRS